MTTITTFYNFWLYKDFPYKWQHFNGFYDIQHNETQHNDIQHNDKYTLYIIPIKLFTALIYGFS